MEHNADTNIQDDDDSTALMMASINGYSEVVRLLINEGAELDQQTSDGFTALIMASQFGHTDVVKLLLDSGANPEIFSREGKTAVDYTENAEIKNLLSGCTIKH